MLSVCRLRHDSGGTPHNIESVWVDPDMSTRTIVAKEFQNAGSVICSFHPGGAIGISPQSRLGLASTIIPTLSLIFLPSLTTIGTLTISRCLSTV
jgi:hypothetical protein